MNSLMKWIYNTENTWNLISGRPGILVLVKTGLFLLKRQIELLNVCERLEKHNSLAPRQSEWEEVFQIKTGQNTMESNDISSI